MKSASCQLVSCHCVNLIYSWCELAELPGLQLHGNTRLSEATPVEDEDPTLQANSSQMSAEFLPMFILVSFNK